MKKLLVALGLMAATVATAAPNLWQKVNSLEQGAEEAKTIAYLGKPVKKEFMLERTAYTYCTGGAMMRMAALMFEEGKLIGVQQSTRMIHEGSCVNFLPSAFLVTE